MVKPIISNTDVCTLTAVAGITPGQDTFSARLWDADRTPQSVSVVELPLHLKDCFKKLMKGAQCGTIQMEVAGEDEADT